MSEESAAPALPPQDDQLAELRELLAVPERQQVQRIEQQLTELRYAAAELGRVLPEAITLQAGDAQGG